MKVLIIGMTLFSQFALVYSAKAQDFYTFEEYKKTDADLCVECGKGLELAKEVHAAVKRMINEGRVNQTDVVQASDKLQGLITVTQDAFENSKRAEECPALTDFKQVMPPKQSYTSHKLLLSKEIPLSTLDSFGIVRRKGTRNYFKGHDGNKEILVETTLNSDGRLIARYYEFPHSALKDLYDLPDLGSSLATPQKKRSFLEQASYETKSESFGGELQTSGQVSLKKGKASVAAAVPSLDSKGSIELDKKGKSTLRVEHVQEYFTVHYDQTFERDNNKDTSTLKLAVPKGNSAITYTQKSDESKLDLDQTLSFYDSDVVLQASVTEKGKAKPLVSKSVVINRNGSKVVSASMDSNDNFSVNIPTQFTVSQAEQIEIKGDNSFGSKEVVLHYTVSARESDLIDYTYQTKRDSSYTRQTITRQLYEGNKLGRMDVKVQQVSGAQAEDKERNETTVWLTFKGTF